VKRREVEVTPASLSEQAKEYGRRKNFLQAIIHYQAASVLQPEDGDLLARMGEMAEKVAVSYDEFRRIMNLYQRAIERSPMLLSGYIRLGLLETEQFNLDRGFKLLNQAVALAPQDAVPCVALGKHFFKRQDYKEALAWFSKAYELRPTDPETLFYFGKLRLVFKKGSAKDAMDFFYRAYRLDSEYHEALAEWLKLKALNYERTFAFKFLRNLMEQEPDSASLRWVQGEIHAAGKEHRQAIAAFHASLDLDNRSSRVRMSLARSLEAVGEGDKAVAEFRLASIIDRRNSEGFYRAAEILFQNKKYKEAEEALKFLMDASPNYPGAHRYLSQIYYLKNERGLAIREMKEEVARNPMNTKYRTDLAELYMEYDRYDDAISQLVEITNLPPISKAPEFIYDKIRGYLLLSRSYRAQSKLESAEAAIKLALEIDSEDPQLHRELGHVYHALQRDRESVNEFETYLNRNPTAQDADTIKQLINKIQIEE